MYINKHICILREIAMPKKQRIKGEAKGISEVLATMIFDIINDTRNSESISYIIKKRAKYLEQSYANYLFLSEYTEKNGKIDRSKLHKEVLNSPVRELIQIILEGHDKKILLKKANSIFKENFDANSIESIIRSERKVLIKNLAKYSENKEVTHVELHHLLKNLLSDKDIKSDSINNKIYWLIHRVANGGLKLDSKVEFINNFLFDPSIDKQRRVFFTSLKSRRFKGIVTSLCKVYDNISAKDRNLLDEDKQKIKSFKEYIVSILSSRDDSKDDKETIKKLLTTHSREVTIANNSFNTNSDEKKKKEERQLESFSQSELVEKCVTFLTNFKKTKTGFHFSDKKQEYINLMQHLNNNIFLLKKSKTENNLISLLKSCNLTPICNDEIADKIKDFLKNKAKKVISHISNARQKIVDDIRGGKENINSEQLLCFALSLLKDESENSIIGKNISKDNNKARRIIEFIMTYNDGVDILNKLLLNIKKQKPKIKQKQKQILDIIMSSLPTKEISHLIYNLVESINNNKYDRSTILNIMDYIVDRAAASNYKIHVSILENLTSFLVKYKYLSFLKELSKKIVIRNNEGIIATFLTILAGSFENYAVIDLLLDLDKESSLKKKLISEIIQVNPQAFLDKLSHTLKNLNKSEIKDTTLEKYLAIIKQISPKIEKNDISKLIGYLRSKATNGNLVDKLNKYAISEKIFQSVLIYSEQGRKESKESKEREEILNYFNSVVKENQKIESHYFSALMSYDHIFEDKENIDKLFAYVNRIRDYDLGVKFSRFILTKASSDNSFSNFILGLDSKSLNILFETAFVEDLVYFMLNIDARFSKNKVTPVILDKLLYIMNTYSSKINIYGKVNIAIALGKLAYKTVNDEVKNKIQAYISSVGLNAISHIIFNNIKLDSDIEKIILGFYKINEKSIENLTIKLMNDDNIPNLKALFMILLDKRCEKELKKFTGFMVQSLDLKEHNKFYPLTLFLLGMAKEEVIQTQFLRRLNKYEIEKLINKLHSDINFILKSENYEGNNINNLFVLIKRLFHIINVNNIELDIQSKEYLVGILTKISNKTKNKNLKKEINGFIKAQNIDEIVDVVSKSIAGKKYNEELVNIVSDLLNKKVALSTFATNYVLAKINSEIINSEIINRETFLDLILKSNHDSVISISEFIPDNILSEIVTYINLENISSKNVMSYFALVKIVDIRLNSGSKFIVGFLRSLLALSESADIEINDFFKIVKYFFSRKNIEYIEINLLMKILKNMYDKVLDKNLKKSIENYAKYKGIFTLIKSDVLTSKKSNGKDVKEGSDVKQYADIKDKRERLINHYLTIKNFSKLVDVLFESSKPTFKMSEKFITELDMLGQVELHLLFNALVEKGKADDFQKYLEEKYSCQKLLVKIFPLYSERNKSKSLYKIAKLIDEVFSSIITKIDNCDENLGDIPRKVKDISKQIKGTILVKSKYINELLGNFNSFVNSSNDSSAIIKLQNDYADIKNMYGGVLHLLRTDIVDNLNENYKYAEIESDISKLVKDSINKADITNFVKLYEIIVDQKLNIAIPYESILNLSKEHLHQLMYQLRDVKLDVHFMTNKTIKLRIQHIPNSKHILARANLLKKVLIEQKNKFAKIDRTKGINEFDDKNYQNSVASDKLLKLFKINFYSQEQMIENDKNDLLRMKTILLSADITRLTYLYSSNPKMVLAKITSKVGSYLKYIKDKQLNNLTLAKKPIVKEVYLLVQKYQKIHPTDGYHHTAKFSLMRFCRSIFRSVWLFCNPYSFRNTAFKKMSKLEENIVTKILNNTDKSKTKIEILQGLLDQSNYKEAKSLYVLLKIQGNKQIDKLPNSDIVSILEDSDDKTFLMILGNVFKFDASFNEIIANLNIEHLEKFISKFEGNDRNNLIGRFLTIKNKYVSIKSIDEQIQQIDGVLKQNNKSIFSLFKSKKEPSKKVIKGNNNLSM